MNSFVAGRGSRREYWLLVAILVVLSGAATYFNVGGGSLGLNIAWVFIWIYVRWANDRYDAGIAALRSRM